MAKINADCDLTITSYGKTVTEVSAVYNNHFVKRLYVGMNSKQATKKFKEDLKKGKL